MLLCKSSKRKVYAKREQIICFSEQYNSLLMNNIEHYSMDNWPIYFKSTEQGLYFRVEDANHYTQIRLKETKLGFSVALSQAECSNLAICFMHDAGFDPCTPEEFNNKLKEINNLVNATR